MKRLEIDDILLVHHHQISRIRERSNELKSQLDTISELENENKKKLVELEYKTKRIFASIGIDLEQLNLEKLSSKTRLNPEELSEIDRNLYNYDPIETVEFTTWEEYIKKVDLYIQQNQINTTVDPLLQILTPQQYEEIENSYSQYKKKYKWDKWDYVFVGASGILASLTDYLLVKIPKSLRLGQFSGQSGSPITEWLKRFDTRQNSSTDNNWVVNWINELEERCKVPYDQLVFKGMTGRSHRFQSLGHDPVLGFVFGVLDIMRGTITGFSYDHLVGKHSFIREIVNPNADPVRLIRAILIQIGHLVSDVATPAGLPAPFMTLLQGLSYGKFGEKERNIGQLARWMYLNGYDLRHFIVTGITPAVIEIILRAYIMLRHYAEHGKRKILVASNPKYRSMLLCAHTIAVAGNLGKITLLKGNPLAFNYAEWLALIRYLLPSVRYWLFGKKRDTEQFYYQRWEEILEKSQELYELSYIKNLETITLGHLA